MKPTRVRALILMAILTAAGFALPAQAGHGEFTLVFPQPGEATHFVDSWGNARSGGRRHQGTDLIGPQMSPVVAAADGIVERFGKGPRSGYYIVISHQDGYKTWYLHLNNDTPGTDDGKGAREFTYNTDLEVGDPVAAGQLLGFVGDSGNAETTTHHTHFELRLDGRAINPYPFLRAAWERWELELQIERQEVPFS